MANGSSFNIKDFAAKAVVAAGLGIVADGVIEISRAPIFNDSGLFGNKIPNYEFGVYTIAGSITILSILDILINTKPFGISKEALPYSTFFIIGTALWESTLANMLGLRNFNIYDVVENAIPNVRSYLPGI